MFGQSSRRLSEKSVSAPMTTCGGTVVSLSVETWAMLDLLTDGAGAGCRQHISNGRCPPGPPSQPWLACVGHLRAAPTETCRHPSAGALPGEPSTVGSA